MIQTQEQVNLDVLLTLSTLESTKSKCIKFSSASKKVRLKDVQNCKYNLM